VIDPCDATEIGQATAAIAGHSGPVYMRLLCGNVPIVFDPLVYRFEIAKAKLLREGHDVGVISTGIMTERALDAAATLEARGMSVGVLHAPTIKPFDADAVAAFAGSGSQLVTAENHVVVGGLGSLVAECLFERGIARPLRRMRRMGLPDRFIECGSSRYCRTATVLAASASSRL
jgi:transketolase